MGSLVAPAGSAKSPGQCEVADSKPATNQSASISQSQRDTQAERSSNRLHADGAELPSAHNLPQPWTYASPHTFPPSSLHQTVVSRSLGDRHAQIPSSDPYFAAIATEPLSRMEDIPIFQQRRSFGTPDSAAFAGVDHRKYASEALPPVSRFAPHQPTGSDNFVQPASSSRQLAASGHLVQRAPTNRQSASGNLVQRSSSSPYEGISPSSKCRQALDVTPEKIGSVGVWQPLRALANALEEKHPSSHGRWATPDNIMTVQSARIATNNRAAFSASMPNYTSAGGNDTVMPRYAQKSARVSGHRLPEGVRKRMLGPDGATPTSQERIREHGAPPPAPTPGGEKVLKSSPSRETTTTKASTERQASLPEGVLKRISRPSMIVATAMSYAQQGDQVPQPEPRSRVPSKEAPCRQVSYKYPAVETPESESLCDSVLPAYATLLASGQLTLAGDYLPMREGGVVSYCQKS